MLTAAVGTYPAEGTVPIEAPEDSGSFEGVDDPSAPKNSSYAHRQVAAAVIAQDALRLDVLTPGTMRQHDAPKWVLRHMRGIETDDEGRLTLRGPIAPKEPFWADVWRQAQKHSRRPVKMTLPGPLALHRHFLDRWYGDNPEVCWRALADAMNVELRRLAEAGCAAIQVDEPDLARDVEVALTVGVELLDRCFHKVERRCRRVVHLRRPPPAHLDAPGDHDALKSHIEGCDRLAVPLQDVALDAIGIAFDWIADDLGKLEHYRRTEVILGLIASGQSQVEAVDDLHERLQRSLAHIDRHRLIIAADGDLDLLGRDLAQRKLAALVSAAQGI